MASDGAPPTFVNTPYGMVTAAGRWYHIPEEQARAYAGEVLNHVSLEDLIERADLWVDSPRTVTLWGMPLLLWALSPLWAVAATAGLYLVWALASPAVPSLWGTRAVGLLSNVFAQGGYYTAVLSLFAMEERFAAVGAGLAAFVLFRWGIVDWAVRGGLRVLRRRLYPLPVTDQILRGLMVRAALRHRVSVPQVDAITQDILENWGARADADGDEADSADGAGPSSQKPQ
jgi:hypothetical protein